MKRILITGNAGSGKSTAVKKVAAALNIPDYGLDKIVWGENWQRTPDKEQQKQIAQLIKQKSWVIDGVDWEVMKAADMVVFLDTPRRVSFWRAAKRNRKYLFKSRPELPAHCPEILIIPTLIKIIWRFPTRVRPKILDEKARRTEKTFIHIKTRLELEDYIRSL